MRTRGSLFCWGLIHAEPSLIDVIDGDTQMFSVLFKAGWRWSDARAFSFAAPMAWNTLQTKLKLPEVITLGAFCSWGTDIVRPLSSACGLITVCGFVTAVLSLSCNFLWRAADFWTPTWTSLTRWVLSLLGHADRRKEPWPCWTEGCPLLIQDLVLDKLGELDTNAQAFLWGHSWPD